MATNLCALLICVLALGLRVTCRSAPRIRAFPSRVVKKGDTVTIQCSAEFDVDRLRLEGPNSKFWDDDNNNEKRKVSNFTLKPDEFDDGYSYFCRGIVDDVWSEKEDLTLRVIDPEKPTLSAYAHEDDPNAIYLVCKAPDPPKETTISSFTFHNNIVFNCTQYSSGQAVYKAFIYRNMLEDIKCSYVLQVNEYPKYYIDSPKSEKLHPEDKVKDQRLDIEHTPCMDKVEESRTDNDVVTASVCGVLVAVLCIVILVYIMNKKKSSKKEEIKKTNKSEDSIKVEKSNEHETTYCSIDECRNTGKHDVEANVPDTELGGDGITYAEINTSALKKRPDTFNASEDMSNLYAKVKKST